MRNFTCLFDSIKSESGTVLVCLSSISQLMNFWILKKQIVLLLWLSRSHFKVYIRTHTSAVDIFSCDVVEQCIFSTIMTFRTLVCRYIMLISPITFLCQNYAKQIQCEKLFFEHSEIRIFAFSTSCDFLYKSLFIQSR